MPKLSFNPFAGCCGIDSFSGDGMKIPPATAVKNPSWLATSSKSSSSSSAPLTPDDLSLSLAGSNLYDFTMGELRAITRGFSTSNFIGQGGFGPVYKGSVGRGLRPGLKPQTVAVKLLDLEGAQGHKEWMAEVIYLGQLRNPNLVKLIGYCIEERQRVLVYEYMPKGSLEYHLFKNVLASLPWLTRLKIAVGAAKGLAFLHNADHPVIYRDFKASNILLNEDYEAKLSDFGLAKDGPQGDKTHVTTRVMGTQGYAAPEYIMTGHLTTKSDVYGFGVVLLELLTGKRSVDKKRPSRQQNLVEWAKPYLQSPRKLGRLMDSNLEGQYSTLGAQKSAEVASLCLRHSPKHRPDMSAVVAMLEPLLGLRDIPMGTFVYTLMLENGEENAENNRLHPNDEENPNEGRKVRGEAKRSVRSRVAGRRHKMRFSQSVVHSDTALYRHYRQNSHKNLRDQEK